MSSAVLYLAIVAVWAVVLVPMWLRRDGEAGITRLLHKRPEEPAAEDDTETVPEPGDAPREEAPAPRRRAGRATVIARRRRRTAGLSLLLTTVAAVIASGVAPWWTVLPPAALLTGHLALLRVAVGMDTARRQAAAEARALARARAREAARLAEQATEPAEVIELVTPDEVFDQYADDRRAVGE
ncbi:hypothetical protein AGRA3207_005536 [Actinomadura graeca]|uniref:Uncharacterized protein n=1 Tax=Actinomadura graeca TaxID=2750812 RepID=A0ABX8R032_9ACTN|nr:hypothetical protein [Actinomadura graeca]QXJ24253.1 hypothetical protein AGRA3207_005536 [Actinomadura graeca]